MLPGPVFYWELIGTSRRLRYYLARTALGALLLFVMVTSYQSSIGWRARANGFVSTSDMAQFAQATFWDITGLELVALVLLVPSLAAPVIADEKQRKTLQYLLASHLTSAEIVLGKAASRYLHVLVLLLVSLPVKSLLMLMGGVNPALVSMSTIGLMSTGLFLCALGILVSTLVRNVRIALISTYSLAGFWALGPFWLDLLGEALPRQFIPSASIALWPLVGSNPFYVLMWSSSSSGIAGAFFEFLAWQLGASLLMLTISTFALRPIYRRQMDGAPGRRWWRLPRFTRRRGRRPVGDDAMLWKETQTGGSSRPFRILIVLGILFFLACVPSWFEQVLLPAVQEFRQFGYNLGGSASARETLNGVCRMLGTAIYVGWAICVGMLASIAITGEREEDTWISLTSTPLTGREIIRGKLCGIFYRLRWALYLLLPFWLMGTILGAISPVGLVLALLLFALFSLFHAAVGLWFSLRLKSSVKSAFATASALAFCNVGYMMCCLPVGSSDSMSLILAPCTPVSMACSLATPWEVARIFGSLPRPAYWSEGNMVAAMILGVVLYTFATVALLRDLIANFDAILDRPSRPFVPALPSAGPSKKDDTPALAE